RPAAARHHAGACTTQRVGAGSGDRDDPARHGNHHRGDAIVSRRRPAADPAVARDADPRRQRFSFFRRMVDHSVSGARARDPGARGESPGRLAWRRAQSDASVMLEVLNLRVEFPGRRGTLTAVDDVSFSIEKGEILGVVGESGAGKSMTGLAIIGLLEPPGRIAAGQIVLEGSRIDDLAQLALRRLRGRRIRAVFQDPLASPHPLSTLGPQTTQTTLTP